MRTFLIQRAVSSLAGALALSILIFGLIRLVPGDAVTMWMGQEGSMRPEVQQTLRRMFGLADPAYVQYFRWLGDLVQGDLGFSFRSRQPVMPLIAQAVPTSAPAAATVAPAAKPAAPTTAPAAPTAAPAAKPTTDPAAAAAPTTAAATIK